MIRVVICRSRANIDTFELGFELYVSSRADVLAQITDALVVGLQGRSWEVQGKVRLRSYSISPCLRKIRVKYKH